MNQFIAIGTDIGGSHISSAAVNLSTGKLLRNTLSERKVDNQAQPFQIISVWAECLGEVLERVPAENVKGIGLAMPGPFDYVNGIALYRGVPKFENLYGISIPDAIRSSLELPESFGLRFINDASSFAVGEAWAGKASAAERSMAITLGTGFGSAFIENRIPVVDGPKVPHLGCVYHLPVKDGIADDYFSTRWFQKNYSRLTGREVSGVRELAEMAENDPLVRDLFSEFGRNLGLFLAPWLNGFGAEVLVIGGNISNSWNLFGEAFSDSLVQKRCTTRTEISELREDAALFGSAYLFDEKFWRSVQHTLPLM